MGPGGMSPIPPPPGFFWEKKWCNLEHSRAHFSLQNFAILRYAKKMLPLQTSLKKRKKKLKCDLIVLNVSISRYAYASFSQNANLLRSFINVTQGSNLLPGFINRPKSRLVSQTLYMKIKSFTQNR